MGSQVVDTLTAEEFMQQTLQKVAPDDLAAITAALGQKHSLFLELLPAGARPDPDGLRAAMRHMFGVRRRADEILQRVGPDALGGLVARLLDRSVPLADRFEAFVAAVEPHEPLATDLASELLHFTDPERSWLWSRWMWDPRVETGALRLVTMDEFDLMGDTPGETYVRVGEATAFVSETGHAVGFTNFGGTALGRVFGIDVFLACVYGIYMYTVLRMRMTQEFNHVVPELPELARRLLGVWRMEA